MNASMTALALAGACFIAGAAHAQVTVDDTNKWGWGENIGWLNFGDTPSPDGVFATSTFMGGFVWGENVGWLNLGDGTPDNGVAYSNTSGTDFGVNIDPGTGELSGYGWFENLGWLNFGTTPFIGADGARLDLAALRLRGYAWSENAGWINLDDANYFVSFTCEGDFNGDGQIDGADLGLLLGAWGAPGTTDLNGDGTTDGADLGLLLGSWGACL